MMDIEQAQREVLSRVRPLAGQRIPLSAALGRTLAEPVACDIDYPPFDRSVMDGYAVRAADTLRAPLPLKLVGQIAAGTIPQRELSAGETMQINTGAPIPPGADAVVRVELTKVGSDGTTILIQEPVPIGKFITKQGAFARAGDVALKAGMVVTPAEVAVAATAGAAELFVHRRPQVALLATGAELVEIDALPVGAQIRNSNQHALGELVRIAGGEVVPLGTADDDRVALRTAIERGLSSDVLCITGGISMGAFDFVPDVLEECGVSFHVRKIAIKPGRPTIFGTTERGGLVFALPGNPVSAFVGFELLVRPALAALQGQRFDRQLVKATLDGHIAETTNRRSYAPVSVRVDENGTIIASPLSWGGSGDPVGMAGANGFTTRAPESCEAVAGDRVDVLLFARW